MMRTWKNILIISVHRPPQEVPGHKNSPSPVVATPPLDMSPKKKKWKEGAETMTEKKKKEGM